MDAFLTKPVSVTNAIFSDDDGKTWRAGAQMPHPGVQQSWQTFHTGLGRPVNGPVLHVE